MDILWQALGDTFSLLRQVLPAMCIGLFGVEILVQLGLMRKLESVGKPLARISHLPPQSVPAFLTAIGSLAAANVMLSRHYAENLITDKELILGSVFNTVPLHFKETLTYQLPVILPLLGARLCLIYIATFWLAGFLKLGFVVYQGRRMPVRSDVVDQDTSGSAGTDGGFGRKIVLATVQAFRVRWRLFRKMAVLLSVVTFVVQLLVHVGALNALELLIGPTTDAFGLPSAVVAPVSIYILSPMVGIGAMSTLLQQHIVTEYQAIVALLVGGFIMVPVTRLRGTLPRYVSILGWRHGTRVIYITTVLSLVARAIILAWVFLFY
ncbi:hypothetical protein [Desulfocicer niacini]